MVRVPTNRYKALPLLRCGSVPLYIPSIHGRVAVVSYIRIINIIYSSSYHLYMKQLIPVIAIPALFFVSCKKQAIDYTRDNNPYNKTGILPLGNGNIWYYKMTFYASNGQPAFSLDDSLTCSNDGLAPSFYYFPGTVLQGTYVNQDNYTLELGGGKACFRAAKQDEVIDDFTENGHRYIRITYGGSQKINGYDAYKNLLLSIDAATLDTSVEEYYYFAPGIGIVRKETMNFFGGRHLGTTHDLTSYVVK